MKQLIMIFLLGIFYWATAYACGDGRDGLKREKKSVNNSKLKESDRFPFAKQQSATTQVVQGTKAQ